MPWNNVLYERSTILKYILRGISLILLLGTLTGCSRKNNNFFSRTWHAVGTQYNTLYNGNLALEQGKQEIRSNYVENFWNILPVETVPIIELSVGAQKEEINYFDRAENKAVKAIQGHSMMIDGWEENPQIDEAYMLLGKSRYYNQRYVSALDAFNFILQRYPLSNSINQAKLWKEKTRLRLNQETLIVLNLKEILEEESLKDKEREFAAATLAQAYINLTYLDSALVQVENAAKWSANKSDRGRYLFIAGQLHNKLLQPVKANVLFSQVIALNRQVPRAYLLNAHLLRLKNLGEDPEKQPDILRNLENLASDRENRPYLSRIYFEIARYYYANDSIAPAVRYYKRSLYEGSRDGYLKSMTYRNLGDIYLNQGYYLEAGSYYDSTLTYLTENSREHRTVLGKKTNLEDLIYFENTLRANDSILHLASLSDQARLAYFTDYTEKLRRSTADLKERSSSAVDPLYNSVTVNYPEFSSEGSVYYFYNSSAVSNGEEEFLRVWGARPLVDNWRIRSSLSGHVETNQLDSNSVKEVRNENPLFNPITYINRLPDDPIELDSLEKQKNVAHYQLGLIYRDKFNELHKAAEHLEYLLGVQHEGLLVSTKFNLIKVYELMGNEAKAQGMRDELLRQHPNSRFAHILVNQETTLQDLESAQISYEVLYKQYQKQEFEEVINKVEGYLDEYYAEPTVPAFKMLRAMAMGRLFGLEAYSGALKELALDYPRTEEGKKAEKLLNHTLPQLSKETLQKEVPEEEYKILFWFNREELHKALDLQTKLKGIFEQYQMHQLATSVDIYNPQELFVVIHGFNKKEAAQNFWITLSNLNENLNSENSLYISGSNYRIIQIHKNFATYLNKYPSE